MKNTKTKIILIIVTVFVLLAVFTNCSKTGKRTKELTPFRLGITNTTSHLLGPVAKEEGFFEEEGLDVTLTVMAGSRDLMVAMEGGKLDAIFGGALNTVVQQAAGHNLTIFGGAMTNGHGLVLKTKYIPPDFKRGDISVLKGRNIVIHKNGSTDLEILYLMKKYGIEAGEGPDKINIIYLGNQTEAYSAFASEKVDGVSVTPPWSSVAQNAGHTVVYYCNEISDFQNHPCCRQLALAKDLAERPDAYIAFERAIIKAYKFTQENHAKTVEDVEKYITIDKKDLDYEIYGGFAFSHPDPDKKATTAYKSQIVDLGFTNGVDYDIAKQYNIDIYREALAQIRAKYPGDPIYKTMEERFNFGN